MESNVDAVDDQGSGWLEVKKKHRSSSRFSLQSWVGGLSGRNASSCGQPSLNEKDTRPIGKCESQSQKAGEGFAVHSQDSVANDSHLSEEGEKSGGYPCKYAVREDSECPTSPLVFVGGSNGRTGDTEDISLKDKPHAVPKIKWGDLEDDALLQNHEKTVGAGIKFGDIGDDNILACRTHESDCDLVSCSPCKNPQENKLVATSTGIDNVSTPTPILTCKHDVLEKSRDGVPEASSKDTEVPFVNVTLLNTDDVSNCKEIYTEHVKQINNSELSLDCLSSEEVGLDVKFQVPAILGADEVEFTDEQNKIEDSSVLMKTQDESCPPEKTGMQTSGGSIISASVENHGDESISKVQTISALGESGTGESKERFRERLWCFLFENLNRAVDELYLLCELECDLEQMKEAILVLEEAASDFKDLKSRVEEFENVKRSSQSVDGVPITLKSDHRRPHALSWEVRRMTTSPHRAEILSSSLEAFKQIQQERAKNHSTNDANNLGLGYHNHHNASGVHLKKSAQVSDIASNSNDIVMKSKSLNVSSDLSPANFSGEKRNAESGRYSKALSLQNGRVLSQNSYSSDGNSSRLSLKDGFTTTSLAGKGKREQVGLEAGKPVGKKDRMSTESVVVKNPRDIPKKQIPLHERDNEKEKRNGNTWKSMDAWKEKRNWEDILSSPFRVSSRVSHSPGMSRRSAERARTLHDKLMSPEKKKKTAFDTKREAEEKHARAMRIRNELENERVQKLQRTSEKLNRVNEWQAVRSMKLREGMYARHQRSESRHEAFLAQVARRAGDESSKVNEVRFITSLNEENKKLMLRQKLHDSELRRAEKLQVIKAKQKEDMAREEAVLERKKLIEAEKLQRLAETQRKKEEAQVRREEERKASSAAREARAIEQLRRKEERVRAQQEEAELLAQKLVERLRESEQRRKFYLEQIRERASTDFRDQSPLLRRSLNKEGLSKSTSTNNGEDYQANSISGLGDSTLANGTLQHSMKRRIKRIRQRLMALKYEYSEPSVGNENATIGYRTAVGTARVKIGRWLQELQRLRQARKEGAASIGLITAEMIKFLDGKEPELQASRQAGLLDFIASALPASHTSKPEACQVTIHLLKLLRVVLFAPANRSYFLAQNLLPPIIPMLSAALENYIKIAASVNIPGNSNSLASKTSVENFELVSEVLDGFLWTVTTIIGHISSEERQLQMWDGLLELLIAYQVIHRLRDLFALYDRPQVEGSPFPSSILLSIHLLVALTSRPGFKSSIDWESFPVENVVGKVSPETIIDSIDTGLISTINSCEDCTLSLSVLNGSTVLSLPDLPEDRPLDSLSNKVNKYGNSASITEDLEKEPTDSSLDLSNCKPDVPVEPRKIMEDIPKPSVPQKDEKRLVDLGAEHKNENMLNLKQPVEFLLSAISETGLVSLPSLLTAVLLQANNRLSAEQGSNVLPSNFEEVATAVLKVLNNLALLDIKFMQRILARPDLRMEFFHLMSFLLSHCTNEWKAASDKVGLLLLESLFLLGHFSLFHTGNQAVLRWGKSPTILHKVCDLPFVFFSDPELMPVLAGTLVAACYGCEQNKDVIQQELSLDMIHSLLRSCKNVLPAVGSNPNLENTIMDNSSECSNQLGLEFKKPQVDSLRPSRHSAKSSRVLLGKGGALGNNKVGKIRNQRDSRSAKPSEDLALKQNVPASEALMLHYRYPRSFMEKAELFFSAGSSSMGDAP